jgi:hypothetical protein
VSRLLTYLFFLSFCTYSHLADGQTTDCGTSCACILEKANREANLDIYRPDLDFQKALRLYEASRLCYQNSAKEDSILVVEGRILFMFERLKQLKEEAEQAEEELKEKNEKLATQAKALRATEQKLTESYGTALNNLREIRKLSEEKEAKIREAQYQFIVAENRRLDYIVNQLINEKKHNDALGIWRYKLTYPGEELYDFYYSMVYYELERDSTYSKDDLRIRTDTLYYAFADSTGMTSEQFEQNFTRSAPLALLRRSFDTIPQILDTNILEYHITPSGLVLLVYPNQIQALNKDGDVAFTINDKIGGIAINPDGRRLAYFNEKGYIFCDITFTRDKIERVSKAGFKIREEIALPNVQGLSFSHYSTSPKSLERGEYLVVVTAEKFFIHNQSDRYIYDYSEQGWSNLKVLSYPGTSFKSKNRPGEAFIVQYTPDRDKETTETRLVVIAPQVGKRNIKLTQYKHHPGGLTIEPGRNFVIGHGLDNKIKYMNENGRQLAFFQALEGQMTVSPFDDRGNTSLSIHTDTSLWVYNLKGQPWLKLEGQFDQLLKVYHSRDNASVITCDKGRVQLWSVKGGLISQTEDLEDLGYGKIVASTMSLSRNSIYLLTEEGYWMQYSVSGTDPAKWAETDKSLLTDKEIQAYGLSR